MPSAEMLWHWGHPLLSKIAARGSDDIDTGSAPGGLTVAVSPRAGLASPEQAMTMMTPAIANQLLALTTNAPLLDGVGSNYEASMGESLNRS